MRWTRFFGALSSRNYRLYFGGQIISLIGNWMTSTASLWLVYHLSSSPFLLGVVGFASQAPMFVLAPFAGVWVDRLNRHRLLIATQFLSMLQSFALAAFALTNTIDIPHIIVLSLIQGVIDAFDLPVRQAMVVEFVERKEHLSNAIALNSSLFNLARLIGPAIAGFVIAGVGAGFCFLIDGLSYLTVIAALLLMRLRKRAVRKVKERPWVEFRQGFHYAFGFAPVRALILLIAAVSATGFSWSVLMPMFARDVFHGDARTLGWLMSASGVGAVTGALYLGGRKTVRGLGLVITIGGTFMGTGLIGFALSRWLSLSLLCLALLGLGGVLLMASSNTLVQTLVDDDKRGRVMSIFATAFSGTMPLGNLMVGALAGQIGATFTLIGSGAICIVIVAIFHRNLPGLRAAAAPALAKHELLLGEPGLYPVSED
jgi:MFS family permease